MAAWYEPDRCANCGRQLEQPATGRKRRTCSDRCRKAVSRDRQWRRDYGEAGKSITSQKPPTGLL